MHFRHNLFALVMVTGLFWWAVLESGPLFRYGELQFLPGMLICFAALSTVRLLIRVLNGLAGLADWLGAYAPSGKSGTARWGAFKDIKRELNRRKVGPFWGRLIDRSKRPLFIDFASNAVTVAPAGSGKGIYSVVTNALSIKDTKIIPDFKGELSCILKQPLEARGETVRILNPGGLWEEQIGESDGYSPIDIIVDDLLRLGGLRDVPDDLRELTTQLYPEPDGKESENTYFREGSRRLIADVILLQAMVEEYDATLSSVALLIEDRTRLEDNLRWVAGLGLEDNPLPEGPMPIERTAWAQKHGGSDVAEFAALVRARAGNWLKLMSNPDGRTFDSFVSGAQQALAPFAFGRLSSAMGRSSFHMDELKKGKRPVTLFIVADSSRMESYKPYIGLMQWCAFTAIKRHENKHVPVYAILDEATNYKINGLADLLTWGRGYGLKVHMIFQDFSAFERVYGKTALETLLSETEIKQFLPGQRSPKTLALIEKLLGDQSVMVASLAQNDGRDSRRESTAESARPLMKADEIRRSARGLLIVRRCLPLLFEPISYAQVKPWRTQAGVNPFHGKPFLRKVKLKL